MLAEIYYQTRFLSSDECDQIVAYYKENKENAVRGQFGYPPNVKVDFNKRICKLMLIDQLDSPIVGIAEKVARVAKTVNEDIFLFDVDWEYSKQPKNKGAWITEYDGAEKAHWAKNQRVNWISNHMQTKLCASIVLSDPASYEGGDILYSFGSTKDLPTPSEARSKGFMYIYPAFRYTQINPVLSGYKYHLDFNFYGPYWR